MHQPIYGYIGKIIRQLKYYLIITPKYRSDNSVFQSNIF